MTVVVVAKQVDIGPSLLVLPGSNVMPVRAWVSGVPPEGVMMNVIAEAETILISKLYQVLALAVSVVEAQVAAALLA